MSSSWQTSETFFQSELPRILFPRTPVNKERRKGRSCYAPALVTLPARRVNSTNVALAPGGEAEEVIVSQRHARAVPDLGAVAPNRRHCHCGGAGPLWLPQGTA